MLLLHQTTFSFLELDTLATTNIDQTAPTVEHQHLVLASGAMTY